MALFLFEFKKIMKTKVFSIFIATTIIGVVTIFFYNYFQQDDIQTKKVAYFSERGSEVLKDILLLREQLKTHSNDDSERRLSTGELLFEDINTLIKHIENREWKKELEAEIKVYENAIKYKELKGSFKNSNQEMKDTMELNKKLLEVNLPKEDDELSIQPMIFMEKISSLVFNGFGFYLLTLLFCYLITKEFEERNMRWIFTLPIAKSKYVLVKFVCYVCCGLFWCSSVFLLSFFLPII
ncbi:MAG: ABC transporter permease, partial [Bacilli bacterium]